MTDNDQASQTTQDVETTVPAETQPQKSVEQEVVEKTDVQTQATPTDTPPTDSAPAQPEAVETVEKPESDSHIPTAKLVEYGLIGTGCTKASSQTLIQQMTPDELAACAAAVNPVLKEGDSFSIDADKWKAAIDAVQNRLDVEQKAAVAEMEKQQALDPDPEAPVS